MLLAPTNNTFETEALLVPWKLEAKNDFVVLFRLYQGRRFSELDILKELAECLNKLFLGRPAYRRRRWEGGKGLLLPKVRVGHVRLLH